ncbi:MAG: hypothetical protein ACRD2C_12660 [Acidimicrobiales bacterium]
MSDPQPAAALNITAQYEDHRMQPADPGAVMPWEEARDRLVATATGSPPHLASPSLQGPGQRGALSVPVAATPHQ